MPIAKPASVNEPTVPTRTVVRGKSSAAAGALAWAAVLDVGFAAAGDVVAAPAGALPGARGADPAGVEGWHAARSASVRSSVGTSLLLIESSRRSAGPLPSIR
jgi:hypothetical protein